MKNIQSKAIQIGGYLRIMAIAIAITATLVFGSKAYAIAPHMPDMALQAEVDMHRESVEKSKDRKANDRVQRHKEHKSKEKSKGKGSSKPKKEKKPPKPSKEDKKRAARDKARNLNRK